MIKTKLLLLILFIITNNIFSIGKTDKWTIKAGLGIGVGKNHVIGNKRRTSIESEFELGLQHKTSHLELLGSRKFHSRFTPLSDVYEEIGNIFASAFNLGKNEKLKQKIYYTDIYNLKIRYNLINKNLNTLSPLFFIGIGLTQVTAVSKLIKETKNEGITFDTTIKKQSQTKRGPLIEIGGGLSTNKFYFEYTVNYTNIKFNFDPKYFQGNRGLSGVNLMTKIGINF